MGRVILCMLGAFSLTYGFVVKAVNSGTKFYMVWMGIGILCLLWALLVQLKLPTPVSELKRPRGTTL